MSKLWPEDTYEDTSYDYDDEEQFYDEDGFCERERERFRCEWDRYVSDDCKEYNALFRGIRLA